MGEFYYAEIMLDGRLVQAYTNMTLEQVARAAANYSKDVTKGNNHTIVFGRIKDLNQLGKIGERIEANAKDYNTDISEAIRLTEEYYEQHGKGAVNYGKD